ncbi:MAG: serine/threonine-protein phosphatase [Acetobacteraceae bacterium]|nr:serine/threonine-protein phosphatase [Acetobacteraceae bacterium]
MSADRILSWHATHPGTKRKYNEDTWVDRPDIGIWAVADGAGGHQAGEVASGMIAEALDSLPTELSAAELLGAVRARIAETHQWLRDEAERRGNNTMIASTVVAFLARGEHFACLWAGDSRAYMLRDGEMRQITKDHSLVQELVDNGTIKAEDAENHPHANVITRAIGADIDLVLDKVSGRLQQGDKFLLCSDGLCKTVPFLQMAEILQANNGVPPPQTFIAAALALSVTDNVTAVTIEVPVSARKSAI